MSETKEIICLANSFKHGGRCVAGIELIAGRPSEWIRPVGNRQGHALYPYEIRTDGRKDPQVLDVIHVELEAPVGTDFQSENWSLALGAWRHVGTWNPDRVLELLDYPDTLWGSGESSKKGLNDRVAESDLPALTDSLALVRPEQLRLHVLDGGFMTVRREVRAIFEYGGLEYNLKITDPVALAYYLAQPDGIYEVTGMCLTVSLAEAFEGFSYKLVAALVPFTE